MPKNYEVVFIDKIVGSERRVVVEVRTLQYPAFDIAVMRAQRKICRFLGCKPFDLIFRSLRVI